MVVAALIGLLHIIFGKPHRLSFNQEVEEDAAAAAKASKEKKKTEKQTTNKVIQTPILRHQEVYGCLLLWLVVLLWCC